MTKESGQNAVPSVPTFEVDGNNITITKAPYSKEDQELVDDILDKVEQEDFDVPWGEIPDLLDRYPFDMDLVNAYLLAVAEIDGPDAAVSFADERLMKFFAYLQQETGMIVGKGITSDVKFPSDRDDNRALLRVLFNQGFILDGAGNYSEALAAFLLKIELDPGQADDALDYILHLAVLTGQLDRVKELLERPEFAGLTKMDGDTGQAGSGTVAIDYGLGLFHFVAGDRVVAREHFERGIRRNPNVVKLMFERMQPVDSDAVADTLNMGAIVLGEESEAVDYIDNWFDTWQENTGALDFLRTISLDLHAHEETVYRLRATINDIEPPVWRVFEVESTSTFQDLHETICNFFGWLDTKDHEFEITAKTSRDLSSPVFDRVRDLIAEETFIISMVKPREVEADDENLDMDDEEDDGFDANLDQNSHPPAGARSGGEVVDEDEDDEDDTGSREYMSFFEAIDGEDEGDFQEDEVSIEDMFSREGAKVKYIYDLLADWKVAVEIERKAPSEGGSEYPVLVDSSGPAPDADENGPTGYMTKVLGGLIPGIELEEIESIRTRMEAKWKAVLDRLSKRQNDLEAVIQENTELRNRLLDDLKPAGSGNNQKSTPPEPSGRDAKVGRNDPCPCGSGLKYKKCCGKPSGKS
jgi:tetratricopeptide (TPR) repeat protein